MRKLSAAFFAILLHEHGTPDSQTLIDSYITHLFELAEGVFGFAVGEHLMPKLKPEMANRVRAAALGGAVLVEVVPAEHRLRSISMTELERMFDFREFKQLPDPRESIVFFTTKSGIAAVKEMEHRKNRVAVNFVDLADQKRSKKEKPTNQVDLFKILSRKQASVDPAAHNDSSSRMRFPEKLRSQSNNSPLAAFTQARAADESTGFQQSTEKLVAGSSEGRVASLRQSWLRDIRKKKSGKSLFCNFLRERKSSVGSSAIKQTPAHEFDRSLMPNNLHSEDHLRISYARKNSSRMEQLKSRVIPLQVPPQAEFIPFLGEAPVDVWKEEVKLQQRKLLPAKIKAKLRKIAFFSSESTAARSADNKQNKLFSINSRKPTRSLKFGSEKIGARAEKHSFQASLSSIKVLPTSFQIHGSQDTAKPKTRAKLRLFSRDLSRDLIVNTTSAKHSVLPDDLDNSRSEKGSCEQQKHFVAQMALANRTRSSNRPAATCSTLSTENILL